MIDSKRNIFFTLLLNLFNILIITIGGILILASSRISAAFAIPLLGIFFLPLGSALLMATHKNSIVALSMLIDFLLGLVIFRNIPIVLTAFLFSCIIGAVIGYLIKKNISLGVSYFIIVFAYFLVIILAILILAYGLEGKSITGFFYDGYNNLKQLYDTTYTKEIKNLYMLQELPSIDDIMKAFPAAIAEVATIVGFLYYIITKKIMKSLGFNVEKTKPFVQFYLSNLLGAFLILAISIGLILGHYGYLGGEMIANMGFSIVQILLIVNGSAFLYNLLSTKFHVGGSKRILILILSIYLLTTAITIIGFAEMIFDFRKLDPNRIFQKKRG